MRHVLVTALPYALSAALLLAPVTRARAQARAQTGALEPGDRVQARVVVGPPGVPVGLRCEGWVERAAGAVGTAAGAASDTLQLRPVRLRPGGCPPGAYLADVQVARGERGTRAAHVAWGLVGGALAGVVLARL
ncbi:MAG TPA: hypothetical protein VEZ47_08950, partial [Gemmatirosa sp.]|nr:hypothetical protein [Gemmatirosa sp.]